MTLEKTTKKLERHISKIVKLIGSDNIDAYCGHDDDWYVSFDYYKRDDLTCDVIININKELKKFFREGVVLSDGEEHTVKDFLKELSKEYQDYYDYYASL